MARAGLEVVGAFWRSVGHRLLNHGHKPTMIHAFRAVGIDGAGQLFNTS